jgi:hypothetical protein
MLREPIEELVGINNLRRFLLISGNPHDSSQSSCLISSHEDGLVAQVGALRD